MYFFFVSSPIFFFCFTEIVGGPGRGRSAAGSRGSAGVSFSARTSERLNQSVSICLYRRKGSDSRNHYWTLMSVPQSLGWTTYL